MVGRRSNCRSGFTLIELLVVMGIMALMVGLAIPAIQGMTKSSGMQSATMQLRSTMTFARQWAITRRDTTYVLFVTNNAFGAPMMRGYNVYSVKENTWLRDWMTLPGGIIFVDGTHDSTNNVLGNWPSRNNEVTVSGTAMKGFRFRADGSSMGLDDIYTKPTIYVTEATFTDLGVKIGKGEAMTNGLQISSMAGQVRTFQL